MGLGFLIACGAFLGNLHGLAMVGRWIALAGCFLWAWHRRTLTSWIMVSMLVGIEVGMDSPEVGQNARVLSKIFLRLVKTVVAPLLFATLVVGVAGHSNLKQVGRMGLKSLIYFEVVTTLALFIGLAAINLSQAGVGVRPPAHMEERPKTEPQTWEDVVLHVFPENIARSVHEGQVLQVVVFSLLFGVSLALLPEDKKRHVLHLCEGLADVMFKFTNLIMYFAPIGVGAAMAYAVGHMGLDILVPLFKLVATLYVALVFFILCVLLPVALFFRVPLLPFIQAIADPVGLAFATTSSEAALPKAMERLEKFGCPRQIVAFVLPTGYSFNLDGTTLYLALASIFVAQAAGIEKTMGEQVVMMLTLMLTSKGVAGVPRASLVILLGTAASFGLPEWPILAILGVDELMDMARTATNVIGNCLATCVISRWEGEFRPPGEREPEPEAAA
ncbi:MAG: cation:dicarboxylase symporter family transporter [Candidatus Eremiobacterota bacterium]